MSPLTCFLFSDKFVDEDKERDLVQVDWSTAPVSGRKQITLTFPEDYVDCKAFLKSPRGRLTVSLNCKGEVPEKQFKQWGMWNTPELETLKLLREVKREEDRKKNLLSPSRVSMNPRDWAKPSLPMRGKRAVRTRTTPWEAQYRHPSTITPRSCKEEDVVWMCPSCKGPNSITRRMCRWCKKTPEAVARMDKAFRQAEMDVEPLDLTVSPTEHSTPQAEQSPEGAEAGPADQQAQAEPGPSAEPGQAEAEPEAETSLKNDERSEAGFFSPKPKVMIIPKAKMLPLPNHPEGEAFYPSSMSPEEKKKYLMASMNQAEMEVVERKAREGPSDPAEVPMETREVEGQTVQWPAAVHRQYKQLKQSEEQGQDAEEAIPQATVTSKPLDLQDMCGMSGAMYIPGKGTDSEGAPVLLAKELTSLREGDPLRHPDAPEDYNVFVDFSMKLKKEFMDKSFVLDESDKPRHYMRVDDFFNEHDGSVRDWTPSQMTYLDSPILGSRIRRGLLYDTKGLKEVLKEPLDFPPLPYEKQAHLALTPQQQKMILTPLADETGRVPIPLSPTPEKQSSGEDSQDERPPAFQTADTPSPPEDPDCFIFKIELSGGEDSPSSSPRPVRRKTRKYRKVEHPTSSFEIEEVPSDNGPSPPLSPIVVPVEIQDPLPAPPSQPVFPEPTPVYPPGQEERQLPDVTPEASRSRMESTPSPGRESPMVTGDFVSPPTSPIQKTADRNTPGPYLRPMSLLEKIKILHEPLHLVNSPEEILEWMDHAMTNKKAFRLAESVYVLADRIASRKKQSPKGKPFKLNTPEQAKAFLAQRQKQSDAQRREELNIGTETGEMAFLVPCLPEPIRPKLQESPKMRWKRIHKVQVLKEALNLMHAPDLIYFWLDAAIYFQKKFKLLDLPEVIADRMVTGSYRILSELDFKCFGGERKLTDWEVSEIIELRQKYIRLIREEKERMQKTMGIKPSTAQAEPSAAAAAGPAPVPPHPDSSTDEEEAHFKKPLSPKMKTKPFAIPERPYQRSHKRPDSLPTSKRAKSRTMGAGHFQGVLMESAVRQNRVNFGDKAQGEPHQSPPAALSTLGDLSLEDPGTPQVSERASTPIPPARDAGTPKGRWISKKNKHGLKLKLAKEPSATVDVPKPREAPQLPESFQESFETFRQRIKEGKVNITPLKKLQKK